MLNILNINIFFLLKLILILWIILVNYKLTFYKIVKKKDCYIVYKLKTLLINNEII